MPFLEQKFENCQESLLSVLDVLIGNIDRNALKYGQPEVFENFRAPQCTSPKLVEVHRTILASPWPWGGGWGCGHKVRKQRLRLREPTQELGCLSIIMEERRIRLASLGSGDSGEKQPLCCTARPHKLYVVGLWVTNEQRRKVPKSPFIYLWREEALALHYFSLAFVMYIA